jgi:VanZ family protein
MVPLLGRAVYYVRPSLTLPVRLGVSAASSSGIGALLEIWQAILPHRDADLLDWVADSIGAATAGVMLLGLAMFFGVLSTTGGE